VLGIPEVAQILHPPCISESLMAANFGIQCFAAEEHIELSAAVINLTCQSSAGQLTGAMRALVRRSATGSAPSMEGRCAVQA